MSNNNYCRSELSASGEPQKESERKSSFDLILDACRKLEESTNPDEIRRESRKIQEIAGNLHSLSARSRLLSDRVLNIVDSSIPFLELPELIIDAINHVGGDRGAIFLVIPATGEIDCIPASGKCSCLNRQELEFAEGLARKSIENNEAFLNPNPSYFASGISKEVLNNLQGRSIAVVPLTIDSENHVEKVGAVYFDVDKGKQIFNETDLWIMQFFCNLTALSIRTIRLNGNLRVAYQATVHALVKALEAKDPYTSGHSDRVAEYSERCGKHLRLGMTRLQVLYSAALLHDIGKIGIHEDILNKPSKLTSDEYDHVKTHPEISGAILHGLTFLVEENGILMQHHERYDGKGYPKGLMGDEISLEGAIIQIADAWDAMTSRRIYRDQLDVEAALDELKRNSGTQFNPIVVERFIQMIHEEGILSVDDVSGS